MELVCPSVSLSSCWRPSMKVVNRRLQASFVEKLKGDFENLSIAIADLPVGLIPFPDR